MAIVKDGINGIVKGKAGNVVFYTMYGKNIVRSLPQTNKRKKPSLKQEAQRQKMALVQQLLKPMKDLIKITFAPATVNNAPYHVAKSYNLMNAIKGEYPDQVIDWKEVRVAAGATDLADACEVHIEPNGCRFRWSGEQGKSNDTLVVIAFVPGNNWLEYRLTGVPRSKEEYFWDIDLQGATWHIWLAFRSADEKDISNSLYLGEFCE
ncbi:DUF6266 family protein [Carboxylicivirga marina]|uniref:Uncharacterized protein n=1 Tax=Carboxylicivirga marina TaxID=2800988 RepID=A0ABS1HHT9_9BACT|nr:DUF6266 family protein [Carboxylicivirga marina]MBK3517236.1 hypothetical protein [Carboxylicivirga marina]